MQSWVMMVTDTHDKAGIEYWNDVWEEGPLPDPIDPGQAGRQNRVNRALHRFFTRQFAQMNGPATSLLEIGAARSQWLPYFAREFGFSVTGLDYSATGCDQAREILRRAGLPGQVVEADLFTPPPSLQHAFDVVVSFGVVEHFTNTSACVAALARYLKPGGCMITEIPNLAGLGGKLQRITCPEILSVHVVLSARDLEEAHLEAGLRVDSCDYLINGGFSNLNFSCRREGPAFRVISRLPMVLTSPFMAMDATRYSTPPNRLTSPYIVCVARAAKAT
jgi:SAM-dependent methyltransferase